MFSPFLLLPVGQVFATDADEGDNGLVLYEINRRQSDPDRYFVMDTKSGVITLNRPLDFELKRVHELVVQARDNASQPEVSPPPFRSTWHSPKCNTPNTVLETGS